MRGASPTLSLLDDDVWGDREHDQGGHDSEEGEEDKAQPVENHCGELPVTLNLRGFVIIPDLVGDHSDLLQDESQFSLQRSGCHSFLKTVWKIWIGSRHEDAGERSLGVVRMTGVNCVRLGGRVVVLVHVEDVGNQGL